MKINDSDLKDILINPRSNNTGQFVCTCPFCQKEHHFYINKFTQQWDCKKCGESGGIYKLLKQVDKTYLLEGSTVEYTETLKKIRDWIEEQTVTDSDIEELPDKKLPIGFKTYVSNAYLEGRGVKRSDFIRYNIGGTKLVTKLRDYVIIPVVMNGRVKGYVGRYGAEKVPKDRLRYNNSRGCDFAKMLLGYDEIIKGKTTTVILVEGFFDKRSVDERLDLRSSPEIKCVCTFGKKISPVQISLLVSKGITKVILLYDFDALSAIKKYGLHLEKYFITDITFTSKKDVDECSLEETLQVFSEFQKPRDFAVNVIAKIRK